MIISVTQEHIDRGVRDSCGKCPVALAMKETGKWQNVLVFDRSIQIDDGKYWNTRRTPPTVTNFIYKFDLGYPVEPFSFELEDQP